MKKTKTGTYVGLNSNVSALKVAGTKGTKSGVNSKVSASKVATGKVGGSSKAPKDALPTAKYGMTMKSGGAKTKAMYGMSMKPGMMKMGGAKKK